jgi:hypothetical protein
MNIEYAEGGAIVSTATIAFTYKTEDKVRDFEKHSRPQGGLNSWNNQTNYLGEFILHPYGANNDLPSVIKDVVQNNYVAPGLLNKKKGMLWGTGPVLYTETIEGNKRVRQLVEDAEVLAWLEDTDYIDKLLRACEDYNYIQGVFSKYELKRSSYLGNNFIKDIDIIQPDKARLASLINAESRKATHVITNDWSFDTPNSHTDYKVYPKFDFRNPFSKANSILYSNVYSFCSDYYTVPEIYGVLEWLKRSSAVPLIFKAMSKNTLNLAYHITSPQVFWEAKRKEIQKNCEKTNTAYTEQMLLDYERNFLLKIGEVLSGDENAGKFLHTKQTIHVDGINIHEFGWKITPIDQKTKDLVNSQIKISERSDIALAAGIGVGGSLGNLGQTSANSGSERYYALIEFLNTSVDIPEFVITKSYNYALKANFPKKNLKIGFDTNIPERQSEISPNDRLANQ